MEFDVASMFAIGLCATFVGAIAWAEVRSRIQRRQAKPGEGAPGGGSHQLSHLVKPKSEK